MASRPFGLIKTARVLLPGIFSRPSLVGLFEQRCHIQNVCTLVYLGRKGRTTGTGSLVHLYVTVSTNNLSNRMQFNTGLCKYETKEHASAVKQLEDPNFTAVLLCI